MKFWFVIVVLDIVGVTVGPLPGGMKECAEYAARMNVKIEQRLTAGEVKGGTKANTYATCVKSDQRPETGGPLRAGS